MTSHWEIAVKNANWLMQLSAWQRVGIISLPCLCVCGQQEVPLSVILYLKVALFFCCGIIFWVIRELLSVYGSSEASRKCRTGLVLPFQVNELIGACLFSKQFMQESLEFNRYQSLKISDRWKFLSLRYAYTMSFSGASLAIQIQIRLQSLGRFLITAGD